MKTANGLSRQCSAVGEGARRSYLSVVSVAQTAFRADAFAPSPRDVRIPYAATFSKSGRGSSQTNARHLRTDLAPARGNFFGRNPATRFRKPAL